MSLHLGDKPVAGVYLGDKPVTKIYRGSQLVWSAVRDYAAEVLADSPDLLVRFDSATPSDLSTHGHTVTAVSSPSLTTDPTYGVVRQTGAWKTDATLNQTAYTFEAMMTTPLLSDGSPIGAWRYQVGAMLYGYASGTQVGVLSDSGYRQSLATSAGWHHLVGTWDGTTIRFYVDGVAVRSDPYATAPGIYTPADGYLAGRVEIGTYQNSGALKDRSFRLHSVAYYSTALSPARVAAHAAAIL